MHALLPILPLLVAVVPAAFAADPLTYTVSVATTGDETLDTMARDSATLVSLREKAPVGPFSLVARARGDVGRLTDALHSRGYYLGNVGVTIAGRPLDDPELPAFLDTAPGNVPVPVVVTLTRGPLFTIGRLTLRGDVPPGSQALLGLMSGAPARAADVLAAGGRLLAGLLAQGRALAKVAPPVAVLQVASHTLDVSFDVQAGPKVDLGPIAFAGQTQVNVSYLRRHFLLHQGERFDPAAIAKARQDLASVPALASVRLETPEALDAAGQLPMTVVVTDRPRRAVELGAAYSTDQGGSVSAAWTHRNLFGNAEQLRFSAAATQLGGTTSVRPGYDLGATLTIPDFLQRAQTLTFSLRGVQESLQAYDRTAAIAGVKLERRLSEEITVGIGVTGEIADITQEDVARTYRLVQLPLSGSYDTTNSLLDPTNGVRVTLLVTPTHSFGGSAKSSSFVISQASAATYLDFGRWLGAAGGRSVLAVRGLAGTISGAEAFDIPPDQRFYAGGGGTVRGYRFQSIGPTFPDRNPAGGTTVEVGSVEVRQRFGESYGAVAFVDAGQVGGGPEGLAGDGVLRVGAGVGARYYTSFGPIRLDVAVPLTKDDNIKTDVVEAYIGIGQAF